MSGRDFLRKRSRVRSKVFSLKQKSFTVNIIVMIVILDYDTLFAVATENTITKLLSI